jgi:glycosyltransferase involved in cell wall biosynthesis
MISSVVAQTGRQLETDAPSDSAPIELTILMPCLNEAETLATCIQKARQFLQQQGVRGEVLIADNGSTDGSQQIAAELGARVIDVPVRGYGAALSCGSAAARGAYIIMGDSDDSYDFTDLSSFLARLREGYDLVMGNRFRGRIKPGAMPWKNRYLGNPVLTAIGRLFFRCPVGDFHCGLRGYSAQAFRQMDLRTTGMEFASEMVIKANLLKMRVCEVATTLSPDGRSRPPHLRPWRDGWRHLRFMLLYSPRWLFLYPGLLLIVVGLLLGIRLMFGPITLSSNRGFDINTLAYAAAMVIIGMQAVAFSILSKVFAVQEGLLPPDPRLERLLNRITLEVLLPIGLLLFLAGVGGSFAAVVDWGERNFGVLDPEVSMRLVIPSILVLTVGCQLIFNSFFLSLLLLRVQRPQLPAQWDIPSEPDA